MQIEKVVVGELETNCYVLIKNNNCLIIDPGADSDKIISKIGNKKLLGIIITHYHFDHIGALEDIKNKYKTVVYDFNNLNDNNKIGEFNFKMIITKGHHDTCITLYFEEEKVMFVGDFIFKDGIGRTDLGGSNSDMKLSIEKILKYDSNITIYPGHGKITSLKIEEKNLKNYQNML